MAQKTPKTTAPGILDLDPVTIRKARSLARKAGRPIVTMTRKHTTVSVERATMRLAGLEADHRRHRIFDPIQSVKMPHLCADGDDRSAEPLENVEIMYRVFEQYAGTGALRIGPPVGVVDALDRQVLVVTQNDVHQSSGVGMGDQLPKRHQSGGRPQN